MEPALARAQLRACRTSIQDIYLTSTPVAAVMPSALRRELAMKISCLQCAGQPEYEKMR
jgi:hypothetical protein